MFTKIYKILPDRVVRNLTAVYFRVSALNGGSPHTNQTSSVLDKMKIRILPALSDNYMYLIVDESTKEAAVVDPAEPNVVIAAVEEEGVKLTKILTTHHHWDHAGGNEGLVKKLGNHVKVYGGDERIDKLTDKVGMGDKFQIGNLNVRCLFTPCHTSGHICYLLEEDSQKPAVFTGDTLFVAGCGRFFEGTAEQMHEALCNILYHIPNQTEVYCGHEYTQQNLRFAQHVEGDNPDIQRRIEWANERRAKKLPTVPSTIEIEKLINPFMRVHLPSVQKHAKTNDSITTMGAIRKEKDNFK